MWETFFKFLLGLLPKAVKAIRISKPWVPKDKKKFESLAPDINRAMSYFLVFDNTETLEMSAEEWMEALRQLTSLLVALEKLNIPVGRALADSDDIPLEQEMDSLHECLSKIYVLAVDGDLEAARKLKISPPQP